MLINMQFSPIKFNEARKERLNLDKNNVTKFTNFIIELFFLSKYVFTMKN